MDYRQLAEQYINYADALTERGKPEQAPLSMLTAIAYALLHLAERVDGIDTGNMGSLRDGLDNIEDAINKATR